MQTWPVLVIPQPKASYFELYLDGVTRLCCPNCGGKGEHWYMGEVMPGECVMNVICEDDCVRTLLSLDQS